MFRSVERRLMRSLGRQRSLGQERDRERRAGRGQGCSIDQEGG